MRAEALPTPTGWATVTHPPGGVFGVGCAGAEDAETLTAGTALSLPLWRVRQARPEIATVAAALDVLDRLQAKPMADRVRAMLRELGRRPTARSAIANLAG
jgi:hypothetical protein